MPHNEGYHRRRRAWQPTERQRQVLDALVDGKTNAEIAVRLGITVDGAKWHVGELLSRTGVADRQALAAWWREEREKRSQPVFIPMLFARRSLALTGAVAVLALLVMAGWLLRDRGGSEDVTVPAEQAVDEGFISGGPIRPFGPLFQDFLVEIASAVRLRDIRTGEELGSVAPGYQPMVVVRRAAEELLVASGLEPDDPDTGFHKVVQVYDLHGYSLELKRTIEIPNRINCTTYCQPMVLSRDARYLYYGARTTAPECGAGGDASVCDVHSVVAVDIEDESAPVVSTELRRGCGVPRLAPSGETGAVVTCLGQYPVRGGWTRFIEPDGAGRTLELDAHRPLFNAVTADGSVALFTEGGGVTKYALDGQQTHGFALPSISDLGFGPRLFYIGSQLLGDDRVFLVFDEAPCFGHPSCADRDATVGFVVFDLETMQIEGYGRVPGAEYYVPQGESVYVLREERIEVLDLKTGSLALLTDSIGEGVEVLLPGR